MGVKVKNSKTGERVLAMISATDLFTLLEIRENSLAELQIQSCRKLDIARDTNAPPVRHGGDQIEYGNAGRQILNALRGHGTESCLSVLDSSWVEKRKRSFGWSFFEFEIINDDK